MAAHQRKQHKDFCSLLCRVKHCFILILTAIAGEIWGIISTFWCGWSILILGNMLEEKGSRGYEEGESLRGIGFIGLVIYLLFFSCILLAMHKKKPLKLFIVMMIIGGIATLCYIFFREV